MTQAARLFDRFKKPTPMEPLAMPKVAIVCPSQDYVTKGFAMSLAAMGMTLGHYPEAGLQRVPVSLHSVEGSLIAKNRNIGVTEALGVGAEYVFFLDSDMQFPSWILRKLLEGAMSGCDIVGGTYVRREPPHNVLGKWDPATLLTSDRLHEVEELPTGCLLIARRVFEKLPGPHWFQTPIVREGEHELMLGEDIFFCRAARAAGFKVWLDVAVSTALGHIGRQVNSIAVAQSAPTQPEGEAVHDAQALH